VIVELKDEGVIGDLLEEYFGADPGEIPVIDI
jgi:hypothetical protein